MTNFHEQDLAGASFDDVNLRGATLRQVDFTGARLRAVDFSDAQIRSADFRGSRLSGVELVHVVINGEIDDVVVNGVDIAPLIDAELNRRMPERLKMRPVDSDGFREAWAILERLWEGTIARARTLSEADLHRSVDGEWSFVQTLRHLNFASAAWVGRMILGDAAPWHPLDLQWDDAPGWDGIPWDRDAQPSLDDVLEIRQQRRAMVNGVLQSLTEDQLASNVSCTQPGWPQIDTFPFKECLLIVLIEEWEHRLYAERDLAVLETGGLSMDTAVLPYEVKPLDASTWDAFAELVDRNNGVFGGCWCIGYHPECGQKGISYRAAKEDRVRTDRAHAALVLDADGLAQGWCQYGSPEELSNIKHRRMYDKDPPPTPDWRITCIFVDKRHRGQGVARAALEGALDYIARAGGGLVEAISEVTDGRNAPGRFLFSATVELLEDHQFTRVRQIGKHAWIVSRVIGAV